MEIQNSVALVTGANRGIGEGFARVLLERGAAPVDAGLRLYAGAVGGHGTQSSA